MRAVFNPLGRGRVVLALLIDQVPIVVHHPGGGLSRALPVPPPGHLRRLDEDHLWGFVRDDGLSSPCSSLRAVTLVHNSSARDAATRQNPLRALLVAGAIGFGLGFLARRG